MQRFSILIFLLLAAFIVKAQDLDCLKPDAGTLTDFDYRSDYKSKIRQKLLADLSEFPIARVIVCPSFESEFVISIETKKNKDGKGYDDSNQYLILRTCNPSIWSCIQNNNDSSIVFTKEILIDSTFYQTIKRLFNAALSKARFSFKPTNGLDGTNYYFITTIMFENVHCGYTWSPDSATKMFELCQIAELMRDYCETNEIRVKNEIINKSNKLIDRFEGNKIKKQVCFERYIWISITSLLIIVIILLILKINKTKANRVADH
jgi:hypothetical protein